MLYDPSNTNRLGIGNATLLPNAILFE